MTAKQNYTATQCSSKPGEETLESSKDTTEVEGVREAYNMISQLSEDPEEVR